jgi:hypothetical protein
MAKVYRARRLTRNDSFGAPAVAWRDAQKLHWRGASIRVECRLGPLAVVASCRPGMLNQTTRP